MFRCLIAQQPLYSSIPTVQGALLFALESGNAMRAGADHGRADMNRALMDRILYNVIMGEVLGDENGLFA